jgi:hypothetical protein
VPVTKLAAEKFHPGDYNRMKISATLAALVAVVAVAVGSRCALAEPSGDPYASLRLYEGKWDVVPSGSTKEPTHLENRCAKTGLFFACEQVVNGKTAALVVFLPLRKAAGGGQEYRTEALSADADAPGDWSTLTIDDGHWVYAWKRVSEGKTTYWRTINVFTGPDAIHFEVQRSDDGQAWTTRDSGDERRIK